MFVDLLGSIYWGLSLVIIHLLNFIDEKLANYSQLEACRISKMCMSEINSVPSFWVLAEIRLQKTTCTCRKCKGGACKTVEFRKDKYPNILLVAWIETSPSPLTQAHLHFHPAASMRPEVNSIILAPKIKLIPTNDSLIKEVFKINND